MSTTIACTAGALWALENPDASREELLEALIVRRDSSALLLDWAVGG